ncbi:MAG: hypothetical protein V3S56_09600, partial [Gemmatimonadota bacterium]
DIASWNDNSSLGGTLAWSSSDGSMEFTLTSSSDTSATDQTITVSSSLVANENILKFRLIGEPGDSVELKLGTSSSQSDLISAIDKRVGYHCVPFTPNSTKFTVQYTYKGDSRVIGLPSTGSITINTNIDDISIISNGILELQTPYNSSQLFELEGPQSADVLYHMHNDVPTHRLERRGHTDWSLVEVPWIDGPYLDINLTETTLSADSTDGRNVIIEASTTLGINDDTGFGSSDIGRAIRLSTVETAVDNWGWGVVTGSTSTLAVTVDVKRDFPSTVASPVWRLGSFSDETGWPGVANFFEQRLVLGRTTDQPQTLFLSQTADFEFFAPDSASSSEWEGTVEDDDGMNYTVSSDQIEAIEWFSPGRALTFGTRSAEWEVGSDGPIIKPTDIQITRNTSHGSARQQPVQVGNTTIFTQRAKRRIRAMAFDFEADGLVASDLARLSPHISVGGLVEMDYQQERESIVWMVRTDGQLVSMTYRPEEDVVAFGRHILGGSYGTSNAEVKSITTVPGSTDSGQTQDSLDRDELWMIVRRTINGSTVRYVEFMERSFEDGDSQEDSYYSDALLTYDSVAASSISGSSHLAAETAKVFANGAVHVDVTVSSSGVISLDTDSSVVQVGLGLRTE